MKPSRFDIIAAACTQKRAAAYYHASRYWRDKDPIEADLLARQAAYMSLTARRLMGVEE